MSFLHPLASAAKGNAVCHRRRAVMLSAGLFGVDPGQGIFGRRMAGSRSGWERFAVLRCYRIRR